MCLLVPCHRVVGAGGKLTGYAGGLARKRFLLDLEAEVVGAGTAGCSEMASLVSHGPGVLRSVTDKRPFAEVVSHPRPDRAASVPGLVGPVDADDAWSETFLSALRAYPTLPADANVEAWLVTIAHRKVIDLVRKAQRSRAAGSRGPGRADRVRLRR